MTHKVRFRLKQGFFFGWIAFGAFSGLAQAGLEFNESAPAPKTRPAMGSEPSGRRVQVFGRGVADPEAETTAEARPSAESPIAPQAEPIRNRAEVLRAEAPREREASSEDATREYQRLLEADRRARRQAETEGETASDASEAPTPRKPPSRARSAPKPATPRPAAPRPAAAPKPEMETETITPQGSAPGTSRKAGKPVGGSARAEIPDGPQEPNPAFPYTHLLPSPFNVPQGTLVVGTSLTYGIFDFLQVSTNLMRTLNEHWNFQGKVPLIEYPTFMATAWVDFESFNPRNISELNPDLRYSRWQPGLTTAYELGDDMALFLGGNFSFGKDPVPVVRKSGYLKGARIEADWSWLYNPSSSRLADNAIAAGVSYDLTYELFGLGLTHHWRQFSLGVHYTFADTNRFLPIVGFQAGAEF